ncbi:hypothetical protein PT2222_60268 [Paraburkholderia tropica]
MWRGGSDLDGAQRIEGAVFPDQFVGALRLAGIERVTARICHDARAIRTIVERIVHMAVNPEIRVRQQITQVAEKGGIVGMRGEAVVNRIGRNTVMRDHDRFALERCSEFSYEPRNRALMFEQGVFGAERHAAVERDRAVIRIGVERILHVARAIAIQRVIGPQATAQKTHVADHGRAAFQKMHVRAFGSRVQRRGHVAPCAAIGFMIAADVDDRHGPVGEGVEGLGAPMNIAREHQHVGAGSGRKRGRLGKARVERVEVQIGGDLNTHKGPANEAENRTLRIIANPAGRVQSGLHSPSRRDPP